MSTQSKKPTNVGRAVTIWTPERVPLIIPLAGIGERALAYLVDVTLLVLGLFALLFLYNYWGDLERDLGLLSGSALALVLASLLLSFVAYDLIFEVWGGGRTPGKRLFKLRVLTESGDTPDVFTSAIRNVLRLFDFLPSFYGFGAFFLFFTQTRRAGDLVAGTFVIVERGHDQDPLQIAERYAEGQKWRELPPWPETQTHRLVMQLEISTEMALPHAEERLAKLLSTFVPDWPTLAPGLSGSAAAGALLLALAQKKQGLAAEIRSLQKGEQDLVGAEARLKTNAGQDAAHRLDDAIRSAGSALMRAARLQIPPRRLEGLSLRLLAVERARRRRPSNRRLLLTLLQSEIPRAIYGERAQVLRAAVVLFGAALLGFALSFADATVGRALLGDELAAMIDSGAAWTNSIEEEGNFARAAFTIILNNARVGFLAFAAGLLGGIGTLLLLAINGLHLGAVFGFAAKLGTAGTLTKFILAHGPVELSAICVAGAAGLCVGRAILRPGARSRREALRVEGAIGARILLGATLGFLVIGTVEGFISPGALFPWPVNLALGLALWLLFFGWVRIYGTRSPAPQSRPAAFTAT